MVQWRGVLHSSSRHAALAACFLDSPWLNMGKKFIQCCESGMFIPDPDFYPSRILIFTHPGSRIQKQQQKRGVKKNICQTFFWSHKFHKIVNFFTFEMLQNKIWANFQRIIELFTPKIVTKLSKIWIWDRGSRIRKKPIPDPGSRGQKGTGSRIRISNTEFNQRIWTLTLTEKAVLWMCGKITPKNLCFVEKTYKCRSRSRMNGYRCTTLIQVPGTRLIL